MLNTPATIEIKNLPVMTYKDQPVATSAMLAQYYGTDPRRIRQNFKGRKDRFIIGRHYFKLSGPDLAEFRRVVKSDAPFAPPALAREINLWTERGAARHAKMLDTEQAWAVWEAMEDDYFRRGGSAARGADTPAPAALLPPPASANLKQLTWEQWAAIQEERGDLFACKAELVELKARLKPKHSFTTPEERAQIHRLRAQGLSYAQIAIRTNRSEPTVAAIVKKHTH